MATFNFLGRYQSGSTVQLALSPHIPPTSNNLAVIPKDWEDYSGNIIYDGDPQICFLDYAITHSGSPSIRLEPHTIADRNVAREVDGRWLPIKAGDVIQYGCWIKTDPLPPGYTVTPPYGGGGRICFDYYDSIGYIPFKDSEVAKYTGWWYDLPNNYVPYDSNWVWRGAKVVVPETLIDNNGVARHPSSVVLWVQVWDVYAGMIPNANAWFADTELYINP